MENSFYYINTTSGGNVIDITGRADFGNSVSNGFVSIGGGNTKGIHPVLAFKYIKKKFGVLENMKIKRRLEKLEKAFYQAIDNGQEALSEKFLRELSRETRESALYAKGIKYYIERSDISRVKYKIKDGHIADTKFEDFTKIIPKNVLNEKKKYNDFFDGFVIYHYYNNEIEEKIAKKQKMSKVEIEKMKDPILFGWIKECDRLYFIADWEDEYCDLTFDEIVDVIGENKLTKYPRL